MFKASRKLSITLMAATTFACAGVAIAQILSPGETIKLRQQGFKDLGAASKLIRDQLQGGNPDAEKIKAAAANIKKAADAIDAWFPKGSGAEAGVKTAAKAEIWSDAESFTSARRNFIEQAGKFVQLANTADAATLGSGVKALGQSCSGCHDKFRLKDG